MKAALRPALSLPVVPMLPTHYLRKYFAPWPFGQSVRQKPYCDFVATVPLLETAPVLLDVCVVVTVVALLLPMTVVETMFCEPIAVIDNPLPPNSRPCLAAATCAAELPSSECILLESSGVPDEPVAPHIRLDELLELDTLPELLCALAVVEKTMQAAIATIA